MIRAIYPGSFDPITNGHLDIIERAAKTFDVLYVAVMINNRKKYSFTLDERINFIKRCVSKYDNVVVVSDNCLTVELAKKLECKAIVRGIRAVSEYESELAQATANMMLNKEIETYFMVSRPELSFLSSSVTKEIAAFGGDISPYIPCEIHEDVVDRLMNK